MNKDDRRRRRNEIFRRKQDALANPVEGSWDVEYECGAIKNFPPTNPSDIEDKVKAAKHVCNRRGCRPFWYRRREIKQVAAV